MATRKSNLPDLEQSRPIPRKVRPRIPTSPRVRRLALATPVFALALIAGTTPVANAIDRGVIVDTENGGNATVRSAPSTRAGEVATLSNGTRLPDAECLVRTADTTVWTKLTGERYIRADLTGFDTRLPSCGSAPRPDVAQESTPRQHEDVFPAELVDRWRTDHGGDYYFTDGDIVTEQLRSDPWITALTESIRRHHVPPSGHWHKSVMEPRELVRATARDIPGVLGYLTSLDTSDAAITIFGSYSLRYKVERLGPTQYHVTYDIYNKMSQSSATRVPVICYEWECELPFLNHPPQTHWVHMTQVIEPDPDYALVCEFTPGLCPGAPPV